MPAGRDRMINRTESNNKTDVWTYGNPIVVQVLPQYSIIAGEKVNPLVKIGSTYKVTVSINDDTDNGKGDIKFMMLGQSWQLSGSPIEYEKVITATSQMTRISEARRDSASANSVVRIEIFEV